MSVYGRDCLATVCVNSCTSLFSGFVIFSYLGYMSVRDKKAIVDVAADGNYITIIITCGPTGDLAATGNIKRGRPTEYS